MQFTVHVKISLESMENSSQTKSTILLTSSMLKYASSIRCAIIIIFFETHACDCAEMDYHKC